MSVDKLIYQAMTGAKALEQRQHALANNLANASTDGFRADLSAFRAVPVRAEGTATTRVFSLEATSGFETATGPLRHTDNPLDMAVRGGGWFAVNTPDGQERYTRNGSFMVGADGNLQTLSGLTVVGDGGAIAIPENGQIHVGSDGTVSARVGDQAPVQLGRLKLVNPPPEDLIKQGNGLVALKDDGVAPADEGVTVAQGTLEGSNVNVVESMIGMIALSRQFEMQMRMLQTAEANDARATSVLSHEG
ncbi:MAG: flagellar basal-body rod protein FlgF [Burkholderiaceae bacterium]